MSVTLCTVESGINVSKAGTAGHSIKKRDSPAKNGTVGRYAPNPGPLSVFQDGTPLNRKQVIAHQCKALQQIGLDVANYSSHSFRIGAAST